MQEGHLLDGDDEIDGVVVLSTPKAACEVGAGVGGGVEVVADGAKEAEVAFHFLCRDVEVADHVIDGDVVSEGPQAFVG